MSDSADTPDPPKKPRRRHKPAGLSEQELKFCLEYIREKNGTRSVIHAGYTKDYHAASQQATMLLRKAGIRTYIDTLLAEVAEHYRMDMRAVLDEMAILARSDLEHYALSPTGEVECKDGVPPSARRAVRKKVVTQTQTTDTLPDGTVRKRRKVRGVVELHDKMKALKCLRDHFRDMEKAQSDNPTNGNPDTAAVGLDLLVRLGAILQAGGTAGQTAGTVGQPDAGPAGADGGGTAG